MYTKNKRYHDALVYSSFFIVLFSIELCVDRAESDGGEGGWNCKGDLFWHNSPRNICGMKRHLLDGYCII